MRERERERERERQREIDTKRRRGKRREANGEGQLEERDKQIQPKLKDGPTSKLENLEMHRFVLRVGSSCFCVGRN